MPATPMTDPRVLRAIAHPVRNRILSELDAFGSMRAADVAEALGVPANQASFHLRQLAKYGLVEEDPDAARDKRDRVWKRTAEASMSVSLNQIEQEPGGKAASVVFRRTKAAWSHHVVDVAYGDDRTPGVMRAISENAIRLTRDEAEQLGEDLQELADRWIRRTREARAGSEDGSGDGDEPRRTYLLHQILMPYPSDAPGASAAAHR